MKNRITYTLLELERSIAGWLQNHDRAIHMHDGHTGYGAEANAKRMRLRHNHVAVLIGLA